MEIAVLTGLTPKQQGFAEYFTELGNASEAYRRSYSAENLSPNSVSREASRLLSHPKIAPYIAQLREEARRRHQINVDSLTADFRDAIEFAKKCGNPSAVVSALVGLMKLHGLGVEKRELTIKDDVRAMTREQLDAYERDIEAQLAALNAKH